MNSLTWREYYALYQKVYKEIRTKDGFTNALVTRRHGTKLVTLQGEQLHYPEFRCGSGSMESGFTSNVLSVAGFGELNGFVESCAKIVARRRKDDTVTITGTQTLKP